MLHSKKKTLKKIPTQTISLRLPQGLLEDIKVKANKWGISYQSLIKMLLAKENERMS